MNGVSIIRPYRTGTRSGTRAAPCDSSSATGSARSAGGFHSAWLSRGTSARAALPRTRRSAGLIRCRGASSPVAVLRGRTTDRRAASGTPAGSVVTAPFRDAVRRAVVVRDVPVRAVVVRDVPVRAVVVRDVPVRDVPVRDVPPAVLRGVLRTVLRDAGAFGLALARLAVVPLALARLLVARLALARLAAGRAAVVLAALVLAGVVLAALVLAALVLAGVVLAALVLAGVVLAAVLLAALVLAGVVLAAVLLAAVVLPPVAPAALVVAWLPAARVPVDLAAAALLPDVLLGGCAMSSCPFLDREPGWARCCERVS